MSDTTVESAITDEPEIPHGYDDGSDHIGTFLRIILPLARPGIAAK